MLPVTNNPPFITIIVMLLLQYIVISYLSSGFILRLFQPPVCAEQAEDAVVVEGFLLQLQPYSAEVGLDVFGYRMFVLESPVEESRIEGASLHPLLLGGVEAHLVPSPADLVREGFGHCLSEEIFGPSVFHVHLWGYLEHEIQEVRVEEWDS